MRVAVNMDRFNDSGLRVVSEAVPTVSVHLGEYGALLAISLPSGSILLAMPISSINPLAPPALQIKGKPDHYEDNRSGIRKIVNALRPACKSKHLPEAVKLMKAAIGQLSK